MTPALAEATALAHPNIALIKYWGKEDDDLVLPAAGSLSLTLDVFPTTTTVTPDTGLTRDVVELDGRPAGPTTAYRVGAFLDLVRALAGRAGAKPLHARVRTRNAVPTGAGLASSASGFAALALAASSAYGLRLDRPGLGRLARRGSGSACRSIVPGLALWRAGDDASSYAVPVEGPPLGMVIVVADVGGKKVSSREAMRRTRDTSPYYAAWVRSAAADLGPALEALRHDDLAALGELVESNALRMHAAIAACRPPIRYLRPESLMVFEAAEELRVSGLGVYATADAGPNVVLVCRLRDLARVSEALVGRLGQAFAGRIVSAGPGPGARLVPVGTAAEDPARGAPPAVRGRP
ncbi:MAG TPA: diphosphomevalonate decarboxylase [Microbacteriaceae bacterium]|nr:diphosphomevalonate decarboxylase [Microbacteriaceae bacterium]